MFKHLFNIITGNDRGKSTSSLSQLGSLLPSEAFGQANQQLYINATTGNLHLKDHSKTIIDLGFNLDVGMVYNSQASTPDEAWRFSLGKSIGPITGKINTNDSSVNITQTDGSTITFNYDTQSQRYITQGLSGGNQYLTKNSDGSWECWQPGTGLKEHYDVKGKQKDAVDAAGNKISFSYDGGGRLQSVQGSSGQKISLLRNGLTTKLMFTSPTGTQNLLATYTYDEQGRLKKSEFPLDKTNNYSINYDYLGNTQALYMIRQGDGTKLQFDYEKQNNKLQLKKITDGENRNYQLNYAKNQTTLTDALGTATQFSLNNQGKIQTLTQQDIQGNPQNTQYVYNADGALQQITYPNGSTEKYAYDDLGLLTTFIDGLQQTTQYCNNITSGVRFSKTQYLQNSQGQQALTTWYIHNDKRELCYEISPAGTVTRYDYDLNSNPIAIRQHLEEQIDVSQFNPNTEIEVSVLDNWWSQLKDKSKISLKEFDYNERGQVKCETTYTDINASGSGIFNEKTAQITTQWGLFNQWETQTERQTTQKDATTTRQYDGLLRLAQETDAEENQTTYQYKSQHPCQEQGSELKYTQIIKLPNGLEKQTIFDHSGRPNQLIETDPNNTKARTTSFNRDKAGRILAVQQPDGYYHFDYFDLQGRLAFEINSKGYLTEHCYDDRDREIETVQYEKNITIDAKNPPTLSALIKQIVNSDNDRYQFNLYNAAGKLQYQIDGENGLIHHFYDSANRKIKIQQYATPISKTNISALITGKTVFIPITEKDRAHYFYYDNNGNLIGELDPDNYVTEYINNAGGHLKEKIYYETQSSYKANFNQVKPTPNPQKDAHLYYSYDAKGKCIREISAENILTTYQYNANGTLAEKIQYKNPVDPKNPNEIPIAHPEDKHSVYFYDKLNRDIGHLELPLGKRVVKKYDAVSNKIYEGVVDLKDNTARGQIEDYDVWGQLIFEINSRGGITQHINDDSGLRLATIDPAGNKTLFYYNEARQLCITVNGEGSIKQEDYNTFDNKPITARNYVKQLTKDQLKTLTGGFYTDDIKNLIESLQDAKDSISSVTRDRRGLTKTETDAEGYSTHYQRNAFKECILEAKQINKSEPLPTKIEEDFEFEIIENDENLDTFEIKDDDVIVMPAKAGIQKIINSAVKLKFLTTTHDYNKRGLETETIIDAKTSDNPNGLAITQQKIYNMHAKIAKLTDARGNEHTYDYDRQGREIKYTDPQNNTQEKTWDAFDRLETETDRCKKVTQYSYQTAERKTTVTTPENRATETQTNVFGEKINTQDANGAVEILERDAGGQISAKIDPLKRRTEDQYDSANRHLQHRDYTQVNTDYKFNGSNNIVAYVDTPKNALDIALKTEFKRDSKGNEIAKMNSRNVVTEKQYDRRGLEINTITDPSGLNLTTSHTHNGLKQKEFTFQGNAADPKQRSTQFLYDSAGREIGKILDPKIQDKPNGLNLKTINTLDKAGNIIAIQNCNGNITHNIFDELNRNCFSIDPTGAVTEFQYDAEGHEVLRRNYANRIDISKISDETTPAQLKQLIEPSTQDRSLYSRYDGDGKLVFSITSTGRVTGHIHDKAGRQIGFTRYSNRIDPSQLTTLDPAEVEKLLVKNPDKDRVYYGILDLAGQLRFNIGPDGHVMEQKFDDRGNIVAKIVYNNTIDINKLNLFTPEEITQYIKPSPQDRITHQIFDGFNRLTYSINSRNYLTEYKYDTEDNPIESCAYYNPITILPNQKKIADIQHLIVKHPKDRTTKQIYDNADRKIKEIDGLGYSEAYEFDALNQIRTRKDKMNYLWNLEYDAAGRKTFERTPETTITNVQFDEYNKLIESVTRCSIVTQEKYDANGNKTSVTLGCGSANPRTITYTYTPNNQIDTTTIENVAVDDPNQITPDKKNRPEQLKTLTTKIVYNVCSQPVAYKNEKDIWSFKVFDTEGHLVYEIDGNLHVTEHQWNAFGEEEKLIRYKTPLAINPQDYINTGLSCSDVQSKLVKDPANDRTVNTEHNKRGSKTKVLQDQVVIYNPLLKGTSLRGHEAEAIQKNLTGSLRSARDDKSATNKSFLNIVQAAPEKQWQYNAFNEEILESELIDPITNRWANVFKWRDLQGNIIATVDANDFITLYTYNGDNKPETRIEFKKTLLAGNFANLAYEDLVVLAENVKDQQKQIYRYVYDTLGQLTDEIAENIIVQQVSVGKDGKPQMINLPPQNLSKHYELDGMGRTVETTHENGKKTAKSFDELGRTIEKTKLPRESKDNNNNPITYIETIQSGYNEFGNKTKIKRTSSAEVPEENTNPKFILPEDQITLRLYDTQRGLNIVEQNPMGAQFLKTWTETKQDARTYSWISYWSQDPTNKSQFQLKENERLSQLRNRYDNVDNAIGNYRRDYKTNTDIATESLFNAFNEKIAEGPGNNQWPLFWDLDQAGRCYRNNENGMVKFNLYDGHGAQTCELKSPLVDLKQYTIPEIQTWDYTKLQRTEMVRDNRGDIVQQNLPAFKRLKPGEAEPLYTGFIVGEEYASFFGAKNINWPAPANMNFIAELKVWIKGTDESKAKELIVKTHTVDSTTGMTRMGADISKLVSDIYEYKLSYYYNDPNINPFDNPPVYSARGEIPFDTNNNADSQNLVVLKQDDCTLILTGKTTDSNNTPLSGVELIQNGQVVARVAANTTDLPGRYQVDLSNQISGTYTFRPIFGFNQLGNPISIWQSSPAGFRLEAYQPNLQMTPMDFPDYDSYMNRISWSNLPPGCENLRGIYEVCVEDEPGHYRYDNFQRDVKDFPANLGNFTYAIKNKAKYSSVTNALYALDSQQQPWYIGNGYNKGSPAETGGKYTLYTVPTNSMPVSADAVTIIHDANTIKTSALQPWMEGMKCLPVNEGEYFKYQFLQLNPNSSNEPESQPFSIITANQPKNRMLVRELGMDDLCINTGLSNTADSQLPQNTMGLMNIQLPKDLADHPVRIVSDLGGDPQFYFGKATWRVNGIGGIFSTKISMSLNIGDDQVPLFDELPFKNEQDPYHQVSHYRFKIQCFSCLPPNTASVQFEYYDYTLGSGSSWRTLQPQFSTKKNFMTIDVQALQFGQYNYRFKAFDAEGKLIDLSDITDVENGYAVGQFKVGSANTYVTPPQPWIYEEVNPTRSQVIDRNTNVIESTDEFGNKTQCTFTHTNKIETEIKPEITVTHANGTQEKIKPTTFTGHDEMGNVIGFADANQHLTIHERNSAGDTTKTTHAEGVFQEFIVDAFGRTNKIIDPLNHATAFETDKNDCVTKRTDALGWEESYYYNELKQRIGLTNGEGRTTRYDLDCWGNGWKICQPAGQITETVYDRNRKPVLIDDGTNKPLTWNLDYFGDQQFNYFDDSTPAPIAHTDKSGATYTITRNYNRQILQQQSSGGNHGNQYGANGKLEPVPNQNIKNIYNEAGHLNYILDQGVQQLTTRYRLRNNGSREGEWFMANDGQVYQDSRSIFNACNWLTDIEDTRMMAKYGFDATGNRRNTLAYYNPDFLILLEKNKKASPELVEKMKLYSVRNWFEYDDADNFTVFDGNLVDGKITIANNKGVALTYDEAGRRATETRIYNGTPQVRQLSYAANDLLTDIDYSDNVHRHFDYFKDYSRKDYSDDVSNYKIAEDANGWISEQDNKDNKKNIQTNTTFVARDNAGRELEQQTLYQVPKEKPITDTLDSSYVGFDDQKLTQATLTRDDNKTTQTFVTYDANGNLQSVQGAISESFRLFITNCQGRIVLKRDGQNNKEYYFYDVNGHPIGRFGDLPDPKSGEPKDVNFDLNFTAVGEKFPPPAPGIYVVSDVATDPISFNDVAEYIFSDRSQGDTLAQFNGNYTGNDPAPVGVPIRIPNLVSTNTHNWQGIYPTYNPNEIIGSTYPNMPFPAPPLPKQHHRHNFLKEVLEFVVGAAILALIPELAGALASMILTNLGITAVSTIGEAIEVASNVVMGGVLGAASSIAQQETARALGDQNHFSWKAVERSALLNAESAGLSAGLGIPNAALKQNFITNIANAEEFAVGMQLWELAFRQEHKFDWKAILTAALQAPVNKFISDHVPQLPTPQGMAPQPNFGLQVPSVLFDDIISQRVYGKVDIELAAADALGSYMGNTAAVDLYNSYKRQADQRPQMQWKKSVPQNNSANQTAGDVLNQLNKNNKTLNKEIQKINKELADLGDINSFTGEPLDTGVTPGSPLNGSNGKPGNADTILSNNTNDSAKNPSYTNRQAEHNASMNQAQAQSNAQQQQANLAAKGSAKLSFWGEVKSGVTNPFEWTKATADKLNEIAKTRLPEYKSLSQSFWSKATETYDKFKNLEANITNVEDIKLLNQMKTTMTGFFDLATKYQAYEWGTKGLDYLTKGIFVAELGFAGMTVYEAIPSQRTKVAFEQTGELIGGSFGTAFGLGVGFGEEFAAPIVSTPIAVATVVGTSVTLEEVGKKIGDKLYDALEDETNGLKP